MENMEKIIKNIVNGKTTIQESVAMMEPPTMLNVSIVKTANKIALPDYEIDFNIEAIKKLAYTSENWINKSRIDDEFIDFTDSNEMMRYIRNNE